MNRKETEARRIQNKPIIQDLAYWKGRLQFASSEYDLEPTIETAEELVLCDRKVKKIEFYVLRK